MYIICERRRRIEPIGTGRANEMPSSDRNLTWPWVNMLALVNPSYVIDIVIDINHLTVEQIVLRRTS